MGVLKVACDCNKGLFLVARGAMRTTLKAGVAERGVAEDSMFTFAG